MPVEPLTVSLNDLASGTIDDKLPEAFGPDSLGILVVSDLPQQYHELRKKVLRSAQKLSKLPRETLSKLEAPDAYYLVGWSHGKEKLASGEYDTKKGSFYVNCSFFNDPDAEGPPQNVVGKYPQLPGYTAQNIWPSEESFGENIQFKKNLKELISLMVSVALTVAAACDRYVSKELDEVLPERYLERIVKESNSTKARLLNYFPLSEADCTKLQERDDGWCGEHLDHSCITALTRDILLNEDGTEYIESDPSREKDYGLFIKDRHGTAHRVVIPPDCLAFQTGSALEALTRGKFKAVPHYVKGAKIPNISRATLAVFCQPSLDDIIADGKNFAEYALEILGKNH